LRGRFPLNEVSLRVEILKIGVYILSRDGKYAHYVGRSDVDLVKRIQHSVNEGNGYKYFWFEYSSSAMEAYKLECRWYHKYEPTDNSIHPAVPRGMNWRCPIMNCQWS